MHIVKASFEILSIDQDAYKKIERAGRTCYKSEEKITDESAEKFVRSIVKNGHDAMLEHAGMTVKFVVDRGVSHELVRHRVASFAQESTRYCNYSKDKFGNEITVVEPYFFKDIPENTKKFIQSSFDKDLFGFPSSYEHYVEMTPKDQQYFNWYSGCLGAESAYFQMLAFGATCQEARTVLPTSLKTEVIMTANMREWRHFFKLRAVGSTGMPHPQMLEVAVPLLEECKKRLPAIFDDIIEMRV